MPERPLALPSSPAGKEVRNEEKIGKEVIAHHTALCGRNSLKLSATACFFNLDFFSQSNYFDRTNLFPC